MSLLNFQKVLILAFESLSGLTSAHISPHAPSLTSYAGGFATFLLLRIPYQQELTCTAPLNCVGHCSERFTLMQHCMNLTPIL